MSTSMNRVPATGLTGQTGSTGIHHEHALATLLWKTTQQDLVDILQLRLKGTDLVEHIHIRARLLNLIEGEIALQRQTGIRIHEPRPVGPQFIAEEHRRTRPERHRPLRYPPVKELPGLPSGPQRRKKEREHFLGRGNPRRPSEN